jgi:hypothetical protein
MSSGNRSIASVTPAAVGQNAPGIVAVVSLSSIDERPRHSVSETRSLDA